MGAPGNQGWMEEAALPATERLSPARPIVGLEESELDLLRSAPDYDAEEMANVRLPGGWPDVAPPPAAGACKPAPAAWSPPNRIEPPTRIAPFGEAARPLEAAAAASAAGHRFPEERTVALLAEDLLGRPLDEPAPMLSGFADGGASAWFAGHGEAHGFGRAADDASLWDQVMPLVSEGRSQQ